MNEQDLLNKMQQLPNEVEVSSNKTQSQWNKIVAEIESNSKSDALTATDKNPSSGRRFAPMAMAASFVMVAFLSIFLSANIDTQVFDSSQQKTLSSLQQANSQYYSALGLRMKMENAPLPASLSMTLKDLRQAQKHYRIELAQNPDDTILYRRLIKTYAKERMLLKQILS